MSSAYTARVIDSGIAENIPYIAMDLLNGSPLDTHLSERGPVDSPRPCAPSRWRSPSPWTGCTAAARSTATSGPPTSCSPRPFQAGDTAAILNRVLVTGPDQAALDTLGRVSPPLPAVVGLALTRDPDRRPKDGDALLTALLDGGERPPDPGARITRGWRTLHL